MEYKMVYKAYSHAQLIGRQGAMRDQEDYQERSVLQYSEEAQNWSDILNASASEGFTVKNSGAFPLADSIVFWSLLEKQ